MNHQINGRMLIHYASDYGQSEVVQYLISKGANVNVTFQFFKIFHKMMKFFVGT